SCARSGASSGPVTLLLAGGGRNGGAPICSGPPVRMPLVSAPDECHVGIAQALRDRADLAVAEREAVDRRDRRDLVARAAEERLLCDVDLGAIDLALDDRHVQHARSDVLDQAIASDRIEAVD